MVVKRDVPVDQGWSWVICAAGMAVNALFNCGGQVNTILLTEQVERHDTTITTISLMFTAGILSNGVTSIICAVFVLPNIGARWCIVAGGIMSSAASIGQGFSTQVIGVILSEALRGSSQGILAVSSIYLVPHYFNKHKSTASGIIFSGICLSVIIAPVIIHEVRTEFGLSGTYLLLSAVELNICVAGLLFRPVESYRSHRKSIMNGDTPEQKNDFKTAEARKESECLIEREVSNDLLINSTVSTGQDIKLRKNDDDVKPPKKHSSKNLSNFCSWLSEFYYKSSLNLWGFRLSLLACVPGVVSVYLIVYTPTILMAQGATPDDLSLLLTILGLGDLVSRVVMGLLADKHILTSTTLLIITHFYIGVFCQCVRFFTTFDTLLAYVLLLGPVIGSRFGLMPAVVMEVVGTEKMAQAFGLISMLTTLSGGGVFPLFGAITDAYNSFLVSIHILGVTMIVGGLLWICVPLLVKMDTKQGRIK